MTPRWMLNRLRCMSMAEVAHRAGRAVAGRPRVRALPALGDAIVFAQPDAPVLAAEERGAVLTEASAIAAGRVPLFASQTIALDTPPQWNAPLDPHDIKPLWELNRHLHLVRLAQAWALTGDEYWRDKLTTQLHSWLEQCPPPSGPNWKSGLEMGIRLINWSLLWQLLQGDVDPALRTAMLASIRAHCIMVAQRLSRHSSANNHLIGELAGLYVAASTWPCWPESSAWRAQAQRELEREAQRQFSADGVHREQAFAYQLFCCEFLLLAGLIGQASGPLFSADYWASLRRALDFIRAADGVGSHAGDADDGCVWRLQSGRGGQAAQLLALGATLFDGAPALHPGVQWLRHLFPGAAPDVVPDHCAGTWAFPDGGHFLFGTKGRAHGMVDCAPLGYLGIAAHGHADALAVTLDINGEPCLVDPGTYSYWCDARWRDYFRGTSAHNTVRVDGLDQSVGGGRFLWLRKARTQVETMPASPAQFSLRASHNGYLRLADPVRHVRCVDFDEAGAVLVVRDQVTGKLRHTVETFWHFAPHLDVRLDGQGVTVHGRGYALRLQADRGALALVRGADHPPLGWCSRAYNVKKPCTVLRIVNEASDVHLECRITMMFFDKQ
jgi:hypothetical protein